MVASVNRVVLLGSVGKNGVEVRPNTSGASCASFTLVLTELGQDGKTHVQLISCEVWGKKAALAQDLEAGQLVLFEGKLRRVKRGESWETVVAGFDVTPVLSPQGLSS